jgi:hypothetical protein
MRYFEVALDLLKDWRFDHHIAARSKLLEQLLTEIAPDLRVDCRTRRLKPRSASKQPTSKARQQHRPSGSHVNSKPAASRRSSKASAKQA